MLKVDRSDGFYRINLDIDDIPKLGIAFSTEPGQESLIAFTLVLPMGWKNSSSIFSTATKTVAHLANQWLFTQILPPHHPLDDQAGAVIPESLMKPSPSGTPSQSSQPPPLEAQAPSTLNDPMFTTHHFLSVVSLCPTLTSLWTTLWNSSKSTQTAEMSDGSTCMQSTMYFTHHPLDSSNNTFHMQPMSLKKYLKGDCLWSTIKFILG